MTAVYAIGPKLLFALPFALFGDGLWVIGVTNTLLYAAALVLLYAGVLRIFDRATALLTAVVCLSSLSELYFTNLASAEVLGTFFIAALFLLMSRGPLSWRTAAAVGAVGGLAVYNRSNLFPMGALASAQQLLVTRSWSDALKRGAAVQAVTIAVTLPLCAFNYSRFGRFTPLTPTPRLSGTTTIRSSRKTSITTPRSPRTSPREAPSASGDAASSRPSP